LNITNLENIFLIALFIVPGFISIYIRDVASDIRKLDYFEKVVLCVFFSFINLSIIAVISRLIYQDGRFSNMPNIEILKTSLFNPIFLLILFCLSLLIGFLFAQIEKLLYLPFRSFLRLAGVKAGGSETVFASIFNEEPAKCVEVKMKDGYRVAGVVKYVSDDKGQKELYIVDVREYDDQQVTNNKKDEYLEGVYLDLKEAEYVRVIKGVKKD